MVVSQHIPEETIQDVLHRADIVDVIGDYVTLTQRGANAKGLCPFHQEKTPSFTVSSAKGLFYCFGCQASGNVVRFLMMHENLSFPEAVRALADRYGVQIPESSSTPPQRDSEIQKLLQLHRAAAEFFSQRLGQNPSVRDYCRQRHFSREVVERFGLGYAPDTWEALGRAMQGQGFAQELLLQSGLVVGRDHQRGCYDRFRHRLMFPIADRQGRPVAFGGRLLDAAAVAQAPKYLNSPETPIFQKNRTLYGFHLAKQAIRQHGQAIIVEGYTDVMACHRQGVTHVVGTLGTALTETHVDMLKVMVKDVVLVFDADAAGGKATERGIGLFLDAGVRVHIVELPEGDDPDSFLQQHTGDEFRRRVAEARTFLDYLVARARRFSDLRSPTGQADCAAHILPLLRKIDNEVEQWGYVAQLAEHLGLPPDVLQRQLRPASERPRASVWRPTRPRMASRPPSTPGPREEYLLIQELCHDPSRLASVVRQIAEDTFQDANMGAIFAVFKRCAPQWQGRVFPQILQEIENPVQERLLTEMAMAEPNPNGEERERALHDCVLKMKKRQRSTQKQRLIEQMRSASGDHADELLHQFQRLQHEKEIGLSVDLNSV
jgi:DNA primase